MAMVDCPCGRYQINEQEKICPYCGILLTNYAATRALSTEEVTGDTVPRWGTARFNTRMNLILHLRDAGQRFIFDAAQITELTLGRTDPDTGESPSVDLESYNGVEKGVSRKHASIIRRETGSLQLVDRGAPNGTYLNGQRLVAHQPRILRDGDEVRLGNLVVAVRFERVTE